MSFTDAQKTAIAERGNTIVVAGAGAGKTRTLVERCAAILLDPSDPVSIQELLVVTFTEAAAAEVRQRLRLRLEEEFERTRNERLLEQIALLDSAYVSTLHSFCFRLVREHFAELEIDPMVSVYAEEKEKLLFAETVRELFERHYRGEFPNSKEFQKLVLEDFGGRDDRLRDLLRKIHEYIQTRPGPNAWLDRQIAFYEGAECPEWKTWYREALTGWRDWWVPYLRSLPTENTNGHACADLLDVPTLDDDLPATIAAREDKKCWPKGRKGAHMKCFENLFSEAKDLAGFLAPLKDPDKHPLDQDWEWCKEPILTILKLVKQFEDRYAAAKRELGALDFHDLEQLTLRLLWDSRANRVREEAWEWQKRFRYIFVDEYQDINRAQNLILSSLSHPEGNRFLVGDIKQSIYRFRQADPGIFKEYIEKAKNSAAWKSIFLSENFRTQENILHFINPLFEALMRPELGGLEYTPESRLIFGAPAERNHLSLAAIEKPSVEVHLVIESEALGETNDGEDEESETPQIEADKAEEEHSKQTGVTDLDPGEWEARVVASRVRELLNSDFKDWGEEAGAPIQRKIQPKDIVILLRAPSGKAEMYAKAFDALAIPLEASRAQFYATPEVLDLTNLLQILDNPFQDVPVIAVLRSPMVGLTAEELAEIRVGQRQGSFWAAVQAFVARGVPSPALDKVKGFLRRFDRWRTPGQCHSLSQQLERILADTHYGDWVLGQPRGAQAYANLQQMIQIARQFDDVRGEGLYPFLKELERLQDEVGDIEPAPLETVDAVRLMSIHKSKGLEFPVVIVPDLGKKFNVQDANAPTILDEEYGLCARIRPPGMKQSYKSLPLYLAGKRQLRESRGEEIRILYVALTRAKNLLILTGSARKKQTEGWVEQALSRPTAERLLRAGSMLDWIIPILAADEPGWLNRASGEAKSWKWTIWTQPPDVAPTDVAPTDVAPTDAGVSATAESISPDLLAELKQRLAVAYPFIGAQSQKAKTTVTEIRRSLETDEEVYVPPFLPAASHDETAVKRGLACHKFLELLDFSQGLEPLSLSAQLRGFCQSKRFADEDRDLVDLDAIAEFWSSKTGRLILSKSTFIRREVPFTFRVGSTEAKRISSDLMQHLTEGDFVIVQGIADLIVLQPEEMWLLDFKTNRSNGQAIKELTNRYRPQIELYTLALESIFKRKVTKRWLHFLSSRQTVSLEVWPKKSN
jgi:ATP-dependent helicase/nuclease subunit A